MKYRLNVIRSILLLKILAVLSACTTLPVTPDGDAVEGRTATGGGVTTGNAQGAASPY